MLKITAQRAAAMEVYGRGAFETRGRFIIFTGTDGKSAIWETRSAKDAEMQLGSWRRVFAPQSEEVL